LLFIEPGPALVPHQLNLPSTIEGAVAGPISGRNVEVMPKLSLSIMSL